VKITEDMVAQFVHLHSQGQSYRAIGERFEVDPRTVKSRIGKAAKVREAEHWESVSQNVDAKYLEEHYRLLTHAAMGLVEGVQTAPLFVPPSQDPEVLIRGGIEAALERSANVLAGRGIDLADPPDESQGNRIGSPAEDRIVRKLNDLLGQHEKELTDSADLWVERWAHFQRLRVKLMEEARGLCKLRKVDPTIARVMGVEITKGVLESRCAGKDPWTVLVEDREGGPAALVVDKGAPRIDVCVGLRQEMEPLRRVYERVREELSHPERLRSVLQAYHDVVDRVREVEDIADALVLRGRPQGSCSLCPRPVTL